MVKVRLNYGFNHMIRVPHVRLGFLVCYMFNISVISNDDMEIKMSENMDERLR